MHAGVKPYKCHICNKAFSQSNTLAIHLDSHKTTKDYSCELCGHSFKHKISLAQHRKTHDKSLDKSLTCELCSMKFTTADNLKRHIRVTHEKIKLHLCDVCERPFGSNSVSMKYSLFNIYIFRHYTLKLNISSVILFIKKNFK